MINVAWWKEHNNFGDCLTPVLLKRLFSIDSQWSEPENADLIGIGSYLDNLTPTYKGIIWGSGLMFPKDVVFPDAKILALRGKLTTEHTAINTVVGDPGLLCKLICPAGIKKKYYVGVIPHWNDKLTGDSFVAHEIDITQDIDKVIYEVASCKHIVSSSLHGLILADSLNIPRKWVKSPKNPGNGFKFRDYQSVFGDFITPGLWYKADPKKVDKICQSLLKVLKETIK